MPRNEEVLLLLLSTTNDDDEMKRRGDENASLCMREQEKICMNTICVCVFDAEYF